MVQSDKWGSIGADGPIVSLIRQYYPSYPDGPLGELTTDPMTALLAIRVEQERGDDIILSEESSSSGSSSTASYFSSGELVVTSDGPRVEGSNGLEEPDYVDGKKIDAGAVFAEWDIRGFNDDIMVAFKESARTNRDVLYRGGTDNPVVNLPAETRYVWMWRAESAGSNPTVYLEGWS